ncbi:TIGR04219 family outer membrane beta-barrel protein [Marinomonas ostreistagni]|uniref:TIGR04219 family outer membrane beta-barrel protein n=1 Tax=Marinomonas ostreistagni TaxID=359209 RepID=UPI00194E59DD|nr:TIGR04219 family outer membrane beta-barrel protein [Marinomonas ostreistagni]MBM6551596.1 TIGR04219 family outer membrane beta-barrel protein [Marinomonas ostreistagni]
MKKTFATAALLLATTAAQADTLGLTAEVGHFSPDMSFKGTLDDNYANTNFDGENDTYFGIAFEHLVPLVPNVRLQSVTFEGRNDDVAAKIDTVDYTLYYEILDDLTWLNLDAGLTLRQMDVDARVGNERASEDGVIPAGYLSAYVSIPTLPIQVGGEIKAISAGDSSMKDTTFKIKYQSPFVVGIEGGYRDVSFDIDEGRIDSDLDFDGFFVGVYADF